MCHVIFLLFYLLVGRAYNDFLLMLWAASQYFVRKRCISNDNDVSLRARLCSVDELVLSGPFVRRSMHRRSRLPSKSDSFITEYLDLLVVLQSRASQSVIDSLCLCVQLLKVSRFGRQIFEAPLIQSVLFWWLALRRFQYLKSLERHLEDQCGFFQGSILTYQYINNFK